MITTAELHRVADREDLRFDQAEKDYVILWILSGLVHSGVNGQRLFMMSTWNQRTCVEGKEGIRWPDR